MSAANSLSKPHNDTQNAAEGARQSAVAAAGNNQAAINAAAIAFQRAVVRSALANGVGVEPAMTALKSLGVTGL